METPGLFQDAHPGYQTQQVRTPGDDRWYSPNRDIAYVGPALIKQALMGLRLPVDPGSPYEALLNQLTPEQQHEEMAAFAKTLARLVMLSTKDGRSLPTVLADLQAENDPGASVSWQIRTAVLARLGEICLGCCFAALKDITPAGGQPPHQRSIEGLVFEADRMAKLLNPEKQTGP